MRSREEDDELQRSTKKVKENHSVGSPSQPDGSEGGARSYKDKLIGEIPGAYEQAFGFKSIMEEGVESDDETADLNAGIAAVNLSSERKSKMQSQWTKALIVKVIGRTVGYHFLHSRLVGMWKPTSKLDCVALGVDFFLIKLYLKEDYVKILSGGPWFVGGHFLSIRGWVPNFKPSTASVSSIAVWVRLPELPVEYYEPSILRDLGNAIGPVLRIDTHTTTETRGRFARLCVQVDLEKPLIRVIKCGDLEHPVQYEGIHSMCFSCGRVRHKVKGCSYKTKAPENVGE